MDAQFSKTPTTTLTLRSIEDGKNLTYVVEIEEGKYLHSCYSSENYLQALIAAREIFDRLRALSVDLGILIEAQYNRGASYAVNDFSFESQFEDADDFYSELCAEFELENISSTANTAFRKIVDREKLNEYQEQRLLASIKKLNK
jgi:hypothetical protein